MPSVGMRRSTRICVPKSIGKDGEFWKVLRSGKKLLYESDDEEGGVVVGRRNNEQHFCLVDTSDEIACYKSNGWRKVVPEQQDSCVSDMDVSSETQEIHSVDAVSVEETRYKNVYDRKRRRSPDCSSSSESKGDRLHGTVYVRKRLKKSQAASVTETSTTRNNAIRSILDVTVDSSHSSSVWFTCFLASVLKFMRSSSRIRVSGLAGFMSREQIVQIFSRHGVQFKLGFSTVKTVSSGLCRVYGSHASMPLFWIEYLAAPMSFRKLQLVVFYRSLYKPHTMSHSFVRFLNNTEEVVDECKSNSDESAETVMPQSNSESFPEKLDMDFAVGESWYGRPALGRPRSFRKKRSSLMSRRAKKYSSSGFRRGGNFGFRNHSGINTADKSPAWILALDASGIMDSSYCSPTFAAPEQKKVIDPAPKKVDSSYLSPTVLRPEQKVTDPAPKKVCNDYKELKSTFVGLRENVDTLQCSTNVLVIESDRCYREGATIMLECSTSNIWHIAVKVQGSTKYMHQVNEVMRPPGTNRFTHDIIWTSENGLKLEFCDRKDWFIFKELHKNCVSKNLEVANAKAIPVPGVREIQNYDAGEHVPFVRPVSYISFYNNEVARALLKKTANYDMDPDDEKWLEKLNTGLCWDEHGAVEKLSIDKFEEMIDTFEKSAYRSPTDVSNESKMTSLCSDLGSVDVIRSVYQYWVKKRKQKRAALLRIFECQPARKAPLGQENVLRKKRSFKKHANQNGRGLQQYFSEAISVDQEEAAMKRVQEAQRKAREAMDAAILKRKRAQTLMDNADLATYLAAMAVKIADSVQLAEITNATMSESDISLQPDD
ncbi:hypothetical protein ACHQM5_018132 [Ranunculus cassubicifolius]